MICPTCKTEFTPSSSEISSELGKRRSDKKTAAVRENAKLGGWPKGKKRGTKEFNKALAQISLIYGKEIADACRETGDMNLVAAALNPTLLAERHKVIKSTEPHDRKPKPEDL